MYHWSLARTLDSTRHDIWHGEKPNAAPSSPQLRPQCNCDATWHDAATRRGAARRTACYREKEVPEDWEVDCSFAVGGRAAATGDYAFNSAKNIITRGLWRTTRFARSIADYDVVWQPVNRAFDRVASSSITFGRARCLADARARRRNVAHFLKRSRP